ncbi:MAG TPA: hypothetical protein VHC22_07495 [Pirellulales bacterium]|nr:hypothetical protein [Pirellulales bacterium]
MPPDFRSIARIRQEPLRIGAPFPWQIKSGIEARTQQKEQRVDERTAPVELNRQIEGVVMRATKKIGKLLDSEATFRQTGETGKLQEVVDVPIKPIGKLRRPGEAYQSDVGMRECPAQGTQRGNGTEQIAELQRSKNSHSLWQFSAKVRSPHHAAIHDRFQL